MAWGHRPAAPAPGITAGGPVADTTGWSSWPQARTFASFCPPAVVGEPPRLGNWLCEHQAHLGNILFSSLGVAVA